MSYILTLYYLIRIKGMQIENDVIKHVKNLHVIGKYI